MVEQRWQLPWLRRQLKRLRELSQQQLPGVLQGEWVAGALEALEGGALEGGALEGGALGAEAVGWVAGALLLFQ